MKRGVRIPYWVRYPEVQEAHQARLDRIERLSTLDLRTTKGPQLRLHIDGCKGLKLGCEIGDRLPDPFVVAKFIEVSAEGGRARRRGLGPLAAGRVRAGRGRWARAATAVYTQALASSSAEDRIILFRCR